MYSITEFVGLKLRRVDIRYHPPLEDEVTGETLGRDPVGRSIGDEYDSWGFSFEPKVSNHYVIVSDFSNDERNSFLEEQVVVSGNGFTVLSINPDNQLDIGRYSWEYTVAA